MLSTRWTWAVRAIAVLTAALAVGLIAMSLRAARAEAGPDSAPLGEVPGVAELVEPVQAAQPTPAPSYQVPADALPATRARPLSGRPSSSESAEAEAEPAPTRPLVAVLEIASNEGGAATERLALLVKENLEARGHQVSVIDSGAGGGSEPNATGTPGGGTEPLRPDAYVSIRGVAGGGGGQTGIEAWFCELEGSLSGRLADLLLEKTQEALLLSPDSQDGQGNGRVEEPEGFQCDMLLAGRGRMPAVLLELPAALFDDPLAHERVAEGVASGIQQFFQRYGGSLLQQEQQRRMGWPAIGPITSYFGPAHPLGIDIGQSEGPIVAATDGIVTFAGGDPCCSYGLFVVIEGPENITTLYAHFESIMVTTGQRVRQGQWLGIVGCTGHCFGTHLHFEVIDNGVRRDPLLYLP